MTNLTVYKLAIVITKSQVSFVHVGIEPSTTTKLDGDDTTILAHHPYTSCAILPTVPACFFVVLFMNGKKEIRGRGGEAKRKMHGL